MPDPEFTDVGVADLDVLESGSTRRLPRRIPLVLTVGAAVLGIGVLVIGVLGSGVTASEQLEVVAIEFLGSEDVHPNAAGSGWPVKVGMPADAHLPGARLRLVITGDPRRDQEVRTAQSGGALSLEPAPITLVPRAGTESVDIVVAPTDCGITDQSLDEAGYRWRRPTGVQILETTDGSALPISDAARASLDEVMRTLCAPAGPAPTLDMLDARLDGRFRDQMLLIRVAVSGSADEILLHPLDGPGLRGVGGFEHRDVTTVALMWKVTPLGEDTDGVLDALVRVVAVYGDVAYPYVQRIVPPAQVTTGSLTPLRS